MKLGATEGKTEMTQKKGEKKRLERGRNVMVDCNPTYCE